MKRKNESIPLPPSKRVKLDESDKSSVCSETKTPIKDKTNEIDENTKKILESLNVTAEGMQIDNKLCTFKSVTKNGTTLEVGKSYTILDSEGFIYSISSIFMEKDSISMQADTYIYPLMYQNQNFPQDSHKKYKQFVKKCKNKNKLVIYPNPVSTEGFTIGTEEFFSCSPVPVEFSHYTLIDGNVKAKGKTCEKSEIKSINIDTIYSKELVLNKYKYVDEEISAHLFQVMKIIEAENKSLNIEVHPIATQIDIDNVSINEPKYMPKLRQLLKKEMDDNEAIHISNYQFTINSLELEGKHMREALIYDDLNELKSHLGAHAKKFVIVKTYDANTNTLSEISAKKETSRLSHPSRNMIESTEIFAKSKRKPKIKSSPNDYSSSYKEPSANSATLIDTSEKINDDLPLSMKEKIGSTLKNKKQNKNKDVFKIAKTKLNDIPLPPTLEKSTLAQPAIELAPIAQQLNGIHLIDLFDTTKIYENFDAQFKGKDIFTFNIYGPILSSLSLFNLFIKYTKDKHYYINPLIYQTQYQATQFIKNSIDMLKHTNVLAIIEKSTFNLIETYFIKKILSYAKNSAHSLILLAVSDSKIDAFAKMDITLSDMHSTNNDIKPHSIVLPNLKLHVLNEEDEKYLTTRCSTSYNLYFRALYDIMKDETTTDFSNFVMLMKEKDNYEKSWRAGNQAEKAIMKAIYKAQEAKCDKIMHECSYTHAEIHMIIDRCVKRGLLKYTAPHSLISLVNPEKICM